MDVEEGQHDACTLEHFSFFYQFGFTLLSNQYVIKYCYELFYKESMIIWVKKIYEILKNKI